jgi:hypothetical protein
VRSPRLDQEEIVTVAVPEPPKLLSTMIGKFGSLTKPPSSALKTFRMAFELVLVAWTVSMPRCHWACVMWTVSAGGGVPGLTVSVAVTVVVPKEVAVMVTFLHCAGARPGLPASAGVNPVPVQ